MEKSHYLCIGGCGLVSDVQTKCNSRGCWRARNPLELCQCIDGKHAEFYRTYKIKTANIPKDPDRQEAVEEISAAYAQEATIIDKEM
ncbi:MAG: hypothetical protein ACMG6E_02035 [Candidatus Roizmanbacteria bacterium]